MLRPRQQAYVVIRSLTGYFFSASRQGLRESSDVDLLCKRSQTRFGGPVASQLIWWNWASNYFLTRFQIHHRNQINLKRPLVLASTILARIQRARERTISEDQLVEQENGDYGVDWRVTEIHGNIWWNKGPRSEQLCMQEHRNLEAIARHKKPGHRHCYANARNTRL